MAVVPGPQTGGPSVSGPSVPGPSVSGSSCDMRAMVFRLRDPERRLAGVRLVERIGVPGDRRDFRYDEGAAGWLLELPRPPVWRVEYHLELRHPDGGTEVICDPDNPLRVSTAFGDKSVIECADYREPEWLHRPEATGTWRDLAVAAPALRAEVQVRVWSPAAGTARVLIAHDGPEYDKLAGLGRYSAALAGDGVLPPHHLVLLTPGNRNEWYSANTGYAATLTGAVLPRLRAELDLPPGTPVVGLGASLGALALLHAQRRHPAAFTGLFLQSGSFFRPKLDPQESGFARYRRIVRFTGGVVRAVAGPGLPVGMTCGRVEENLSNNREMAAALHRQGYPVRLVDVPDAHNFTGWRDALHPHLTDLLRHLWPVADA